MPLTQKEIQQIREELENCKKPLFLFDDDPDGLSSFLILYRYKKEGKGFVVKSKPFVDIKFLAAVEAYQPDKIFILDMAIVEQEFVDQVDVPIIWIDHHEPMKLQGNIKYFNPRVHKSDEYYPTTAMAYDITKEDLWIAALGCVSDMYLPDYIDQFKKEFPGYIGNEKSTKEIYFNTKLGTLIKIFSFLLKGKQSDVNKSFKILTRIKSPQEILEQESSAGKYLFKRYKVINEEYQELLKEALKTDVKGKVIVFIYDINHMSYTGDLANELNFRNPDKVILVGREKDGEVRMSLRSSKFNLRNVLEKALKGVEGYGGGHEFACGANVKRRDFDIFIEQMNKELK